MTKFVDRYGQELKQGSFILLQTRGKDAEEDFAVIVEPHNSESCRKTGKLPTKMRCLKISKGKCRIVFVKIEAKKMGNEFVMEVNGIHKDAPEHIAKKIWTAILCRACKPLK